MGISSKTTKSNNQSTTVSTPTNPDWVTQPYQDYFGKVSSVANGDPSQYVAPASKLQTTAWDKALGLSSDPGGNYTSAGSYARFGAQPITASTYSPTNYSATGYSASPTGQMSHVQTGSVLDNLQSYMNPATKDLVTATLNDFDQSAGQQRAADDLRAAANSGLGGSGFAIQKALTEGELSRARATTDATLRSNAFDKATQLSSDDLARQLQAGEFNSGADNTAALTDAAARNQAAQFTAGATNTASATNAGAANDAGKFNATQTQSGQENNAARALTSSSILDELGNNQGASDRSTISLLSQLGGDQRGVTQAQQLAPLSFLQSIGGLYGLGDPSLFHGSSTNTTGTNTTVENDPMGQIAKLVQAAAAAAQGAAALSDGRLKRDIETAGYDEKGRRWVDYHYVWDAPDAPKRRGVIAQEVASTDPDAVELRPSGYFTVDYSKLKAA